MSDARTRPEDDSLGDSSLHAVVRDFPEALACFGARGLDLQRMGTTTVLEAGGEELLAALRDALAWRDSP